METNHEQFEKVISTNIKVKKLKPGTKVPTYGTVYSAGADLYAVLDEPVIIAPNETKVISTGVAFEIPVGLVGLVFARSGLSCKQDLAPANKVGVIDSDYRGAVKIILINLGSEDFVVNNGDRIAQAVIAPVTQGLFSVATELSSTSRGEGGFGSTGKN